MVHEPAQQQLLGASLVRWADGRKVISLLRAMPQFESLAVRERCSSLGIEDRERARRLLEEILLLPVATWLTRSN